MFFEDISDNLKKAAVQKMPMFENFFGGILLNEIAGTNSRPTTFKALDFQFRVSDS